MHTIEQLTDEAKSTMNSWIDKGYTIFEMSLIATLMKDCANSVAIQKKIAESRKPNPQQEPTP